MPRRTTEGSRMTSGSRSSRTSRGSGTTSPTSSSATGRTASRSSRPEWTTSGGRARSSSRCPTASGSAGSSTSRRSFRSSAAARAPSSPSWAASAGSCSGSTRDGSKRSWTAPTSVPGRHDQGGWSQARFQRHIEKLVAEHLQEVAEELDRRVRRMHAPKVIVVSSEEMRAEFEELVSSETKSAIVGWTSADAHASPRGAARPDEPDPRGRARTRRRRRCSSAGVRRRDGAVALPRAGPRRSRRPPTHASRCCSTRKAQTTRPGSAPRADGSPPRAGSARSTGRETDRRDDGLDLAMHQTLAHGGTVWAVTAHEDLGPVEGSRRALDDTEARWPRSLARFSKSTSSAGSSFRAPRSRSRSTRRSRRTPPGRWR